jgi:hypothetical protein
MRSCARAYKPNWQHSQPTWRLAISTVQKQNPCKKACQIHGIVYSQSYSTRLSLLELARRIPPRGLALALGEVGRESVVSRRSTGMQSFADQQSTLRLGKRG